MDEPNTTRCRGSHAQQDPVAPSQSHACAELGMVLKASGAAQSVNATCNSANVRLRPPKKPSKSCKRDKSGPLALEGAPSAHSKVSARPSSIQISAVLLLDKTYPYTYITQQKQRPDKLPSRRSNRRAGVLYRKARAKAHTRNTVAGTDIKYLVTSWVALCSI